MKLDFSVGYLKATFEALIRLPASVKVAIVVNHDIVLCWLATLLAFYLRLGEFNGIVSRSSIAFIVSVSCAIPIFFLMNFYRVIFRRSNSSMFKDVGKAIIVYGAAFCLIIFTVGLPETPRTIGLIQPMLLFIFVSYSRMFVQVVFTYWLAGAQGIKRKQALIYGAGKAGEQVSQAFVDSKTLKVVGFIDDDSRLVGRRVNSIPIFSSDSLKSLMIYKGVEMVILALPSVPANRRRDIVNFLADHRVAVCSVPNMDEIVSGRLGFEDVKALDLDDLLGREPVIPNPELLRGKIANKSVMVTGSGGSIGSELCRQILSQCPSRLIMFDVSEYALYEISAELEELPASGDKSQQTELITVIGSVQDRLAVRRAIKQWRPDIIYHAAAYKHVHLVESNVLEGLKNNCLGSMVVVTEAIAGEVADLVLVSTDKAVRPTNIMGASKRMAELVFQAYDEKYRNEITLSIVRFGNVLGSSGSVIPKFRDQIAKGGPVTVTHQDVTRYFMTIPEAAQLVIQASSLACGGEVFVLDMGEPVKIVDLAKRIISLEGLHSAGRDPSQLSEIKIVFSGLRPGEKLVEELLIGDDVRPTSHPKILKASENFIPFERLTLDLETLCAAVETCDKTAAFAVIEKVVNGFNLDPKTRALEMDVLD